MASYNNRNVQNEPVPFAVAGPSTKSNPKSSTSSFAVNQLIEHSRKFSEVNQLKAENELILEQLTFFQNFSEVCKECDTVSRRGSSSISLDVARNSLLESSFKFTVQVAPVDSSSLELPGDGAGKNIGRSGEKIYLTVENKSVSFSFHHKFWYFSIDFNHGQQVTTWTLDATLNPSDSDIFSTRYVPQNEFIPEHIKIHIAFIVQFQGQHYLRIFEVGDLCIDVMFLLCPVKRSTFPLNHNHFGPPYFTKFDPLLNDDRNKFPTISKFLLCVNTKLDQIFLTLLLDDSSTQRGFTKEIQSEYHSRLQEPAGEVIIFVENEKIVLSRAPISDGDSESNNASPPDGSDSFMVWMIRCFNPALLCNLKVAILRRFLQLEGLRVVSPNDASCEELYKAKLKLESLQDAVLNDYLEFYTVARNIGDQIRYYL